MPKPANILDEATRLRVVDWLTVALAVSLPWSTSATGILSVIWLVAIAFTLKREDRDILGTPSGGLPVVLVLLGIVGMAWADVSLSERWQCLDSNHKQQNKPQKHTQNRHTQRGVD